MDPGPGGPEGPCDSTSDQQKAPAPLWPCPALHGASSPGVVYQLVGGWTNPFEKYARQNGFIFPKFRGENSKNIWKISPPSQQSTA